MNFYNYDNLKSTWEKMIAKSNIGRPKKIAVGCDGMNSTVFNRNLIYNLREIERKVNLLNKDGETEYRFGPLLHFEFKKNNGGIRNIYIPKVRDQIVLRLMHEDIINAALTKSINLKLPNPSIFITSFRETLDLFENPYILRTDIQSFYDTTPRHKAIDLVSDLPITNNTKLLLQNWSNNLISRKGWTSGKKNDSPVYGLPQGLSISSSLSEFWLNQLDSYYQNNKLFFRYADDIVMVCESSVHAENELNILKKRVNDLDLHLSDSKTLIKPLASGISWLGLIHTKEDIKIDENRLQDWLKIFIRYKRELIQASLISGADKNYLLSEFLKIITNELNGKNSHRPNWYSGVSDYGQWKKFDSSLHAIIRSFCRNLKIPIEEIKHQLPSLQHQLSIIKGRKNKNTLPTIAD